MDHVSCIFQISICHLMVPPEVVKLFDRLQWKCILWKIRNNILIRIFSDRKFQDTELQCISIIRSRLDKIIVTVFWQTMIILQLSILFSPFSSDMDSYVFVFSCVLQPVFLPFIYRFCKAFRNTDQEKLLIMYSMGQDVV